MHHLIIQSKDLSRFEILLSLLLLLQEKLNLLFISHYRESRQEVLRSTIHSTTKAALERYIVFIRYFHNGLLLIK